MGTKNTTRRRRRTREARPAILSPLLQVKQKVEGRDSAPVPVSPPHSARPKLVTLGVYCSTEAGFFAALRAAQVDTFCDIRRRRGVRGAAYAFANHRRLEARLQEMGIRYWHCTDLAPTGALRQRQDAADRAQRTAKRQRTALSQDFMNAYREERLQGLDIGAFLRQLGPEARVVALFCVERTPTACHRSLVAEHLQRELGLEVAHLMPE